MLGASLRSVFSPRSRHTFEFLEESLTEAPTHGLSSTAHRYTTSDEETNSSAKVWPGETIRITVPASFDTAFRYGIVVYNLPRVCYRILPPDNGENWRDDNSVELAPGKSGTFEIEIGPFENAPPPKSNTAFTVEVRRSNAVIDGDTGEPYKAFRFIWVPAPAKSDITLSIADNDPVLRPWRRGTKIDVKIRNSGYLPATFDLTLLQAPSAKAATSGSEDVEEVDTYADEIGGCEPSRKIAKAGIWHASTRRWRRREPYFVAVRAAATLTSGDSITVPPTRPIEVRYVPWLHSWKDYVFLVVTILGLFWLLHGFPVARPLRVELTVRLDDQSQLPPGGRWQDVTLHAYLKDGNGTLDDREGVLDDQGKVELLFNRHFNVRWPFESSATPTDSGSEYLEINGPSPGAVLAFSDYDLFALLSDQGTNSFPIPPGAGNSTVSITGHFKKLPDR